MPESSATRKQRAGRRPPHVIIGLQSMLLELVVENYAVVERLRVHFHAGLNLLTGETGSGKSIVVDALGLLLGGNDSHRGGAGARRGEKRASDLGKKGDAARATGVRGSK